MNGNGALLAVDDLAVAYDGMRALNGVSLRAAPFADEDITRLAAHRIVQRGIAHVPEGRRVFASATVRDNLLLGAFVDRSAAHRAQRLEAAFTAFPILRERLDQRASTLSGGEQQMLAIARGTMSGPRLLMLDEPSLGIAPILIPHIYAGIRSVAAGGTTVLLVEQNVREALRVADTAYVLQTGRVVLEGAAADLIGDPLVQEAFLGLGAA